MPSDPERLREWLLQVEDDERFLRDIAKRARPGVAVELEALADKKATEAKVIRARLQRSTYGAAAVGGDDEGNTA